MCKRSCESIAICRVCNAWSTLSWKNTWQLIFQIFIKVLFILYTREQMINYQHGKSTDPDEGCYLFLSQFIIAKQHINTWIFIYYWSTQQLISWLPYSPTNILPLLAQTRVGSFLQTFIIFFISLVIQANILLCKVNTLLLINKYN